MKIFLTGATGYIGGAIARAVKRAGHAVHALAHHSRASAALEDQGYVPVRGDLRDPALLAGQAAAADAVIHAANSNAADAARVDRDAVRAMGEAMEGTQRPFLYTSGVWVLGGAGEGVASEESSPDPLAIVSWRGPLEAWLRDAADTFGVRTIIIRPGIVYGDDGGIPGMVSRGELPLVADGAQRWPLVHRDDLADLYMAAMERAPAGAILHGVAGHATAAELLDALSGGREPVRMSLDEARDTLGSFADALALDQRVSSRITRSVTGWTPTRPLSFGRPQASTASTID